MQRQGRSARSRARGGLAAAALAAVGDLYGNASDCDCDFDQDGFCSIADFNLFLPCFQAGVPGPSGQDP